MLADYEAKIKTATEIIEAKGTLERIKNGF